MSSLPVLPGSSPPRRSATAKWRAAVLIGIHLLIALHITHWLVTGRSVTPVEPSEAMAFARAGIVNAGLIFFVVTILLTLVFGRFFCGWACHLVALQDLSRWWLAKIGIRPAPLRSRLLRWVPFIAFVYMFLWPAAYRLWIGDSFSTLHLELTTEHFWATFPGWIVGAMTFVICGFVIVYLLGSKGFCTYACPYGAIYTLADRLAPLRIRVTDACQGCAHCTANCTSNVQVSAEVRQYGMVIDDGCMKCLDCVSVCPNDALYYGRGPSRRAARTGIPKTQELGKRLPWSEELTLAVSFSAAFFTFRGLYGYVPFLMSLGLSAVLAFLALTGLRLARRTHLSLRQFRLKAHGKLLPAGWALAVGLALLGVFWTHSALVRAHQYLGNHEFQALTAVRRAALDLTTASDPLTDAELQRVRRGRGHLEAVQRLGLLPTRGNAWRLSWLYSLSGSPADLDVSASQAIERQEFEAEIHHLRAVEALGEGNTDVALASLGSAVAANPYWTQGHINLGVLQVQAGDLDAARSAFETGLRYSPDSAELLYNLGLVLAYQGDVAGAIWGFEKALEMNPRNLAARENLAGMLASTGRFDESVRHYRQAIEQSPADPQTHYLMARALLGMEDLEGARQALDQCLRLDPEHQEAIILRSSIESPSVD